MRVFAWAAILLAMASSAAANSSMSIQQLANLIASAKAHGQSDKALAHKVIGIELSERLTESTLEALQVQAPGQQTRDALAILADLTAFLDPPPPEVVEQPAPTGEQQKIIIEKARIYTQYYMQRLPNFFCNLLIRRLKDETGGGHLHLHDTVLGELTFTGGKESTVIRSINNTPAKQGLTAGLRTHNEIGGLISSLFAGDGDLPLVWHHWEDLHGRRVAVFRYSFDKKHSHFTISYCCHVPDYPVPITIPTGASGEISIASSGVVLRITEEATQIPNTFPIRKAAVMVEYAPVVIGKQTFICPIRSVSATDEAVPDPTDTVDPQSLTMRTVNSINEMRFSDYHEFGVESRIITAASPPSAQLPAPPLPPPQVQSEANPTPADTTKEETQTATASSEPTPVMPPQARTDISPSVTRQPTATPAENVTVVLPGSVLVASSLGQTQPNRPTETQANLPFQIKVKSNLIVVRVVVRDAKGKPIEGLKKEDFRLFDQNKEQSITQFDVETSNAGSTSIMPTMSGKAAGPTANLKMAPAALPGRFVALYFDDLNTTDEDLMRARAAAEKYLTENLRPGDRVGIFTSDKLLSDFTNDPEQLHDALVKVHSSAHSLARDKVMCPSLSDYQAYEITQNQLNRTTDAWKMAMAEAAARHCGGGQSQDQESSGDIAQSPAASSGNPQPGGAESLQQITAQASEAAAGGSIVAVAEQIVAQAALLARSNLQELGQVVTYLAGFPGQRTIVLVSPGFLSQNVQPELDRIIDRALRLQVAISSIDPRGLAMVNPATDITHGDNYVATGVMLAVEDRMDTTRDLQASDVMAELAQGTGGEFLHNDNDLKNGFDKLAGSPVQYVLTFAPKNMKLDGKFHSLKVRLASKEQKGVSIQARRGYFAPTNEAEAEADARQRDASEAEAQMQEQIREAMLASNAVGGLPVELYAQRKGNAGATRDISFSTHLDTRPLHLRNDAGRNENTVVFALAIFDEKQHLIASQQRRAVVHVPDSQLQSFLKTGIDAEMTFNLKPGLYIVREVVTEAENHDMAAFSREVKVP